MARVKRAVHSKKHHRAVLEQAQGYYGNKSRSYRAAHEQVMHSLQYAFRDRRARKGDFRQLWIQRINAATRQHGMSYSRFIAGLKAADVEVDRKILADLAVRDDGAFAALVEVARQAGQLATRRPADGPSSGGRPLSPLAYKHHKVQRLRRLVGRRSARQAEGRFVVEGTKVLGEALSAGVAIESVYRRPGPDRPRRCGAGLVRAGLRRRQPGLRAGARACSPGWPARSARSPCWPSCPRSTCPSTGCRAARRPGRGLRRRPRPRQRRHRPAQRRGGRRRWRGLLRRLGRHLQPEDGAGLGRNAVSRARRGRRRRRPRCWRSSGLGACAVWGRPPPAGRQYTEADLDRPVALVLGNEAHGLSDAARSAPRRTGDHSDGRARRVAQRRHGRGRALLRSGPPAPPAGHRGRAG